MASTSDHDHDAGPSSADTSVNMESSEELFPGCSSITEFSQQALRTVVQATKTSNDLPTGDDYDYYSTYDDVRNIMDMEARRILQLLQQVMRHQNVKGTITGSDHALELDEQFDAIMDANDQILERVGTWVDEATGVKKKTEQKLVVSSVARPNPAVTSWNKKRSSVGSPAAPAGPIQLLTAKNIQRPQLSFRDKTDNSNKPFIPILRHKPHAKISLQESLKLPDGVTLEDTESPDFVYPHPYRHELEEWQPSPEMLEKVEPQEVKPVETTPAQFIDTQPDLAEMCDLLKTEKEIAIDLEHHSYRSFQGFVCLMQVSTHTTDFLIDTLALRSDMYILNEVFANPNITKVFHGADSDIEWLQRDFGLYVVNMFDTGQAARVLSCARFSLAHLLQLYCQVSADKQYQLADWRMRPLPDKMIRYAQEDTHYLLYIYHCMRNELIDRGNAQRNLLQSVFQRSRDVCLKVYKKPRLTKESHLELYRKSKKLFNAQQLCALRSIYDWRDRAARDEDESPLYVLPSHMLLQMAEILPRERQGVLACCNPIPPLVRQCQHEIHGLIMDAREATADTQVEQERSIEPSSAQHPQYQATVTSCPHDLSKVSARAMDVDTPVTGALPVKKSSTLFGFETDIVLKRKPVLSALMPVDNFALNNKTAKLVAEVSQAFINPFLKFLPQKGGSQNSPIVKPQTTAKGGLAWRLKPNTGLAGNKRKSDVDLNTLTPEFAPPTKRKHTNDTPAQPSAAAAVAAAATPTATSSSPLPVVSLATAAVSPTSVKKKSKKDKVKGEKKAVEEADPLSSDQLSKKKKKEKKAKKNAALKNSSSDITDSPAVPSDGTPQPPTPQAEQKQKKKKKKLNLSVTFSSEPDSSVVKDEGMEVTKKKKKKKKKVVVSEEVMENVTPFDYSAADKSSVTGKVKKANDPEVFNPNFSGSKKHRKKEKKNRFGAKQRKSVTFSGGRGKGK